MYKILKFHDFLLSMLKIYGSSKISAHVKSNLCYLICLRHLVRSRALTNRIFFPKINLFSFHACATCSELLSDKVPWRAGELYRSIKLTLYIFLLVFYSQIRLFLGVFEYVKSTHDAPEIKCPYNPPPPAPPLRKIPCQPLDGATIELFDTRILFQYNFTNPDKQWMKYNNNFVEKEMKLLFTSFLKIHVYIYHKEAKRWYS